MNDVPLVKDNKINDINTSIIAIKKQLKQLNEVVGLIDIPDMPDLSPYIKKSDVVDTVTSGDMHPITSNAVANALKTTVYSNPFSTDKSYIHIFEPLAKRYGNVITLSCVLTIDQEVPDTTSIMTLSSAIPAPSQNTFAPCGYKFAELCLTGAGVINAWGSISASAYIPFTFTYII